MRIGERGNGGFPAVGGCRPAVGFFCRGGPGKIVKKRLFTSPLGAYNRVRHTAVRGEMVELKAGEHRTMAKPVGVISDTHGLLRNEARGRLQGCDLILHAGDVGSPAVLEELGQIARVVAVRGNMDKGRWANELEEIEYVSVEGRQICVIHDINTFDLDPAAAGIHVVVYGHSHKSHVEWKGGVLYLSPGSAGPKRLHLPISMAFLHVVSEGIRAELVEL